MCAKGITEDDVIAYIGGICFKTGPPGFVGVETEWFVTDSQQPHRHVPLTHLRAAVEAAEPLPARSAVSYEPGGQLELSTLPYRGVSACHQALHHDLSHLTPFLAARGLRLTGYGTDPVRPPTRQLDYPRYAAMEDFFDARDRRRDPADPQAVGSAASAGRSEAEHAARDGAGPSPGRAMMCSTASVQVCVDVGADEADARRRWELAHSLGPTLVAAFANSPIRSGRPTGWRSSRQAVWTALDPPRTRAPDGDDPVESWTRYALDAEVMALRRPDGPWLGDPGITFREWLRGGAYGRPTHDDLTFHLSTLFPPVRPRGCLELRMIDAQRMPYWPVPMAVVAALFDDPTAADVARAASEPVGDRWLAAARDALCDPALARCARTCFAAALDALARMGATSDLIATVAEFTRRYVQRGRCPADDVSGDNNPAPESWSKASAGPGVDAPRVKESVT